MPEYSVKLDLYRNLNFSRNFQINAVRKTNIRTKDEFHKVIAEKNRVSPQDLGNVANRISIQNQKEKTLMDRFYDIFA